MQVNKGYLVAISMVALMALLLLPMPYDVANAATAAIPAATNPITQYPWPVVGYDPQCTSLSPGPGPKTNHLLWKRDLGFEVLSLVVWKGKVQAPSLGVTQWCLDAQTGATIYTITDGGFGGGTSAILTPVDTYGIYAQNDLVVRISGSNKLNAYAEQTGELVWQYTGPGISSKAKLSAYRDPMGGTNTPYVSEAHVIHSSNDGYTQWNQLGQLEWMVGNPLGNALVAAGKDPVSQLGPNAVGDARYYAGPCGCAAPLVFPSKDGKYMMVGGPLGRLHQMSYVPSLYRDQTYPNLVKCNYTDNKLLLRTQGANVIVNGSNGYFFWGKPQMVVNCNSGMFANGVIYTGSTNATVEKISCDLMGIPFVPAPTGQALPGYLWAFDAYTGQQLWKWTQEAVGLGPATPSPMIVYGYDKLYLGSYDGSFYCLDPKTANVIWYREDVGAMAGTTNGPVAADGIIYCGGAPWRVYGQATSYALNAQTGETIWSYSTTGAQKHQGAVADGIWYVPTQNGWIYAFGDGPTRTSLDLSTKQLKAGDTVLISGQVLDQSPASPNAAVANAPVTLMYAPLGSVDIKTIATVTTSYSGDYYYEWTVPSDVAGMYSIVSSYAGTPGYKASSATANFKSGAAGFTQAELDQISAAIPPAVDYTPMFYAVIGIAAIALIASIASVVLIMRKK